MKLFITCIALMISVSSFSQLIGWNFDQVVKFKGKDYELKNSTRNDGVEISFATYNKKLYIDGPQLLANFSETFVFKKSSNVVYAYNFLGSKKESEVANIIENNNLKFKSIDKGKKQADFEWLDEKSNTIYILKLMSDVGNDYKYVNYLAEQQE